MSVRMRHTSGHTRNRRSHHGLEEPRLSVCSDCKASYLRHRICVECGRYRGRVVIDMTEKLEKKDKKIKAKKEAMTEEATSNTQEEVLDKPLSVEELSKK